MSKAIIPRNFVLLGELEDGLKNADGLSFGLYQDDDTNMYLWNASIFVGERVYPLIMFCNDNYPNEPPKIAFTSEIQVPGEKSRSSSSGNTVPISHFISAQTGELDLEPIIPLKNWNRDISFESLLRQLKQHLRGLPPPGKPYIHEPAWLAHAKSLANPN